MLKDASYPRWLLWAVIIGDGLFVVLQVPSPSFIGFGLTPLPLLAVETAAYLLGGYAMFRLRVYTSKYVYLACLALTVAACGLLMAVPLPPGAELALQAVVYASLALLNLCWGVCFASFKPAISMVLVVGSYIVWSACSLAMSVAPEAPLEVLSLPVLMPLVSFAFLGFCLAKLDFGTKQKRYAPDEQPESFGALLKSVGYLVLGSLAFSLIFGAVMQMDVLQGFAGYLVSPEAQIGNIAISVALLLYVLLGGQRMQFRVLVAVPLLLATVLMARAVLDSQSFFTSGIPLVLFNFFGQLVWIVFAWKGYESKANSFAVMALGLGSMRLGLLLGRALATGFSEFVGVSPGAANIVSIVGLWVLLMGVLAAVWVVVRRQHIETTPFEPREGEAGAPAAAEDGVAPVAAAPDGDGAAAAPAAVNVFEEKFAAATSVAGLTEREREILLMYASGRSAVRIAEDLFLSNYTVKTHLRRCYAKLDVHSRQELLDLIEAAAG